MPKFTPDYGGGSGRQGNEDLRRCEKCHAKDAHPYCTTALKEVMTRGPRRLRNRQPKWFCLKHRPAKVVNAIDGTPVTLEELRKQGRA